MKTFPPNLPFLANLNSGFKKFITKLNQGEPVGFIDIWLFTFNLFGYLAITTIVFIPLYLIAKLIYPNLP